MTGPVSGPSGLMINTAFAFYGRKKARPRLKLPITTRLMVNSDGMKIGSDEMTKKLPPLHPGEVLREEFLVPLEMSPGKLAKVMDVPRTRVERIVNEQSAI